MSVRYLLHHHSSWAIFSHYADTQQIRALMGWMTNVDNFPLYNSSWGRQAKAKPSRSAAICATPVTVFKTQLAAGVSAI